MAKLSHRRDFLRKSAATGALAAAWYVNPAARAADRSPNEKLNIACVGVGNKGWHNIANLKSQNIVALCDVDTNFLGRAAQTFPQAAQFREYRKLLDGSHKTFDAVVVSTADHNHAIATSIALSLGKHVYCEKPLTHTVREARAIAQLAAKHKVATQMGTQIHAESNYRRVVELIQSGAIGPVREVYNWCNKGWSGGRFAASPEPAPSYLDWDLWLGPAKKRPYSPHIHPMNWRRFWEYGSGTFGDMACHVMDLPFWALKLRHPTSVAVEGPPIDEISTAAWSLARYEFGPRGDMPAVKFYWSDGGKHFELVQKTKDPSGKSLASWGLGILFVGDKGMLAADYGRRFLLPQEKFAGFQPPPKSIPDSMGHWNEWVHACKTGAPTTCNFDYAGALTETVLLGIVALRAGKPLTWDAKAMKATNAPDAEAFLMKHYRKGWEGAGLS